MPRDPVKRKASGARPRPPLHAAGSHSRARATACVCPAQRVLRPPLACPNLAPALGLSQPCARPWPVPTLRLPLACPNLVPARTQDLRELGLLPRRTLEAVAEMVDEWRAVVLWPADRLLYQLN
jgi:hypothetical protein